ncbi:MAG: hypothetical protein ACYC5X_04515 [Syntrophales bacterium]
MRLATQTMLLFMLLGTPAYGADPAVCPIEGEPIHWIADYCMAQLETDDEIPAMDCINEELKRTFPNECAAKQHYKRALCERALSHGHTAGDLQGCLDDKNFIGYTVRNKGVGGSSNGGRR